MFKYGSSQHQAILGPEATLRIFFSNIDRVDVFAIVDTGSPITCIPEKVFETFDKRALPYNIRKVRGAIGETENRKIFYLDLRIAKCKFSNVECLPIAKDFALIGRDILNKYKLLLNGLQGEWEIIK